jgi:hypothetical protein
MTTLSYGSGWLYAPRFICGDCNDHSARTWGQDSVIVTVLIVTGGFGGDSSCGAEARIF